MDLTRRLWPTWVTLAFALLLSAVAVAAAGRALPIHPGAALSTELQALERRIEALETAQAGR